MRAALQVMWGLSEEQDAELLTVLKGCERQVPAPPPAPPRVAE